MCNFFPPNNILDEKWLTVMIHSIWNFLFPAELEKMVNPTYDLLLTLYIQFRLQVIPGNFTFRSSAHSKSFPLVKSDMLSFTGEQKGRVGFFTSFLIFLPYLLEPEYQWSKIDFTEEMQTNQVWSCNPIVFCSLYFMEEPQ